MASACSGSTSDGAVTPSTAPSVTSIDTDSDPSPTGEAGAAESPAEFNRAFVAELAANGASSEVVDCYSSVLADLGIRSFDEMADLSEENPAAQVKMDACASSISN